MSSAKKKNIWIEERELRQAEWEVYKWMIVYVASQSAVLSLTYNPFMCRHRRSLSAASLGSAAIILVILLRKTAACLRLSEALDESWTQITLLAMANSSEKDLTLMEKIQRQGLTSYWNFIRHGTVAFFVVVLLALASTVIYACASC